MRLDTQRLQTLDQVREFLADSRPLDLRPQTRAEAYALVAETLERFDYPRQGKADKDLLRRFLVRVAGLSRAQVTRLLRQHRTTGAIADRRGPRHPFPRRYTKADIGLLAEVDALHGTLSGPATRQLCIRALHVFGDRRFEHLAAISNGHLQPAPLDQLSAPPRDDAGDDPPRALAIGERRRPPPAGQPGYLRVDTVHQGDLDGIKGLYHLNLVDEVTQFQFVGSLERIETPCLAPVLEALLRAFPFTVRGFHANNGTEFINRKVAALLEALQVDEFTKSRPRRSNDNALVESKNGSVIRKHLRYGHIPSRYAERSARPPLRYGPAGDTPAGPQLGWQLWALRPGLDGTSRPSTTSHGTPGQTRDPVAARDPFGGVVMSTPRAPGPPCPEPAVARQCVNLRAQSRPSPVRYVTVWSGRGVDERGAAGALPGSGGRPGGCRAAQGFGRDG